MKGRCDMTKEAFDVIIKKIGDKSRMVIRAKSFEGHGINGTDPTSFSNGRDCRFGYVKAYDSFVHIRFGYNGYMRDIYLPYEAIEWIEERTYDVEYKGR